MAQASKATSQLPLSEVMPNYIDSNTPYSPGVRLMLARDSCTYDRPNMKAMVDIAGWDNVKKYLFVLKRRGVTFRYADLCTDTGISKRGIRRLMRGKVGNPTLRSMQALKAAFELRSLDKVVELLNAIREVNNRR